MHQRGQCDGGGQGAASGDRGVPGVPAGAHHQPDGAPHALRRQAGGGVPGGDQDHPPLQL